MKGLVLLAAIALTAMAPPVHAQFFGIPTVTFDPTQAAHVISQIAQAEKTYTTAYQTTENVIGAYNLAKRMATSPSSLYSGYGAGLPSWVPVLPSNDTYGNTGTWMKSINQNLGTATSAIQSASVARVASLTGYQNLDTASQRAIAAKTATIDLGDSVSATNLSAVGAVRSNQTQRQTDIANLEAASHSLDTSQQTELATLQRINQALLLLLRTQQDQSQLAQGQTLQQLVQQKQQQDELKRSSRTPTATKPITTARSRHRRLRCRKPSSTNETFHGTGDSPRFTQANWSWKWRSYAKHGKRYCRFPPFAQLLGRR